MKLLSAILSFVAVSAIASTAHALSWNETITDDERFAANMEFFLESFPTESFASTRAWAADLNGDGIREVLAIRMTGGSCTASGCRISLLQKDENSMEGWTVILRTTGFVEQMRILNDRENDWNQIVQMGSLAQDADSIEASSDPLGPIDRLWSFDSGRYEEIPYYFRNTAEGEQILAQGGEFSTIARGQTPRLELGEYHLAVAEVDVPSARPDGDAWDSGSDVDPRLGITILESGRTPSYIYCRGQDTTEPVCSESLGKVTISMATLFDVLLTDLDAFVNDDIAKSPTPISAVAACNAVYACEIPLTDPRAKLKVRLFPNF